MKDLSMEEMRTMAKDDPGFLDTLRKGMEEDLEGKRQESCQLAAIQRVLVKAGLCTHEEMARYAEESKPILVEAALACFESDEAVAKAARKYVNWLETGSTA